MFVLMSVLMQLSIGTPSLASPSGMGGDSPPLTLIDAIREAQAADETLVALSRRAEHLRLASRSAGAPPALSVRVSAVAGNPPEDSNMLSQILEIGGQPHHRKAAALAELAVASAEMGERRLTLAWQTATAYSALLAARENLALDREELHAQDALLHITRRRFEVGDIPELQVVRMERERDRAFRVVQRAEQEESAARALLQQLLRRPHPAPLELAGGPLPEPPPDVVALVEEGLRERPDLEMLRSEVRARQADAALVRAQRAPWLELQVRQTRWNAPVSQVGANASLNWALVDWGQMRAQAAQAQSRVEEARARLAARIREAEAQVREAYARWERLGRERRSLESSGLQRALRVMQMVERGYQAGLVTQLEVLEALTALRETRMEAARLRAQEAAAVHDLWRAAGRNRPGDYQKVRHPGGADNDRP